MVQLCVYAKFLTPISRADWSDKSEWYCQTVHCFQNIWFNKRTHPNEHRNGYWLSTKCVLASDQSDRGLCSQSRSCRLRQGCVPEGAVY